MRALSLWQPWAYFIARGGERLPLAPVKRLETRSWPVPGGRPVHDVVIHAARKWDADLAALCSTWPFNVAHQLGALSEERTDERGVLHRGPLAFGAALCLVDVVKVWRAEAVLEHAKQFEDGAAEHWAEELALGNYAPGRYAWELRNVRLLRYPVPVKGRQGLFTLSDREEIAVLGALPEVAHA